MERKAMKNLYEWKDSPVRKPLILQGARQTGKTWLMKEFGKRAFANTVYINFDSNPMMQDLFTADLNPKRLLRGLELAAGHTINPVDTLLIFDEIQEVPRALASLKYFFEEAPEYAILAAGSSLGIALHEGTSFPVGKVEFMPIHPMTFEEFLMAEGKEMYVRVLEEQDFEMIASFRQSYAEALKEYYFTGGMPEAVLTFVSTHDYAKVRKVQQNILDAYEQDFSKHAPGATVPRIRDTWNSFPAQLAKENRKFLYGLIREGGRAREYETALLWLQDCRLVHKVYRVTKPGLPLRAYEDLKAFKLFFLDIGLLACMCKISPSVLLEGNRLFTEFKGALTEQFVWQQLFADQDRELYYYSNDKRTCEVDFLAEAENRLIPIEVKAEENLKAKSLRVFKDKYAPDISVRTSLSNYRKDDWLLNLPLYAISQLFSLCQEQKKGS